MAATGTPTPNLGLRIPVGTDPASVDDINYNSNLLDTVLGAVGNTSVKDQLDELSDQIASINGYQTLVNNQAITTSYATYSTYNNRKFSDYYLLVVSCDIGGTWRSNTALIERGAFSTGHNVAIYIHDGNNTIEIDVKYKSDTSIEAKYSGTAQSTIMVHILGLYPVL